MKFEKFVKQLGSNGIVYVRENEERWLASGSVFIKIPDDIRSCTASDMAPMPPEIEILIQYESFTDPCALHNALMPYASAGIKDCVRIFATENILCKIAVANNDYALIERGDIVEMYTKINPEDGVRQSKALMVKNYPHIPGEEPELVGIVFPIECEEI